MHTKRCRKSGGKPEEHERIFQDPGNCGASLVPTSLGARAVGAAWSALGWFSLVIVEFVLVLLEPVSRVSVSPPSRHYSWRGA